MNAALLLLLACGPKAAPDAAADAAAPASPLDAGPPAVGDAADFTPPVPVEHTLSGGARVWLLHDDRLPLVSLRVVVPGGESTDPGDLPGLTAFADAMLTHGAGDRDAPAFAAEVDQRAIDLYASTRDTATVLGIDAHARELGAALDLLADAVQAPRFDADEVDRVRDQRLGELTVSLDSPRSVASQVADRVHYGEGHPLAGPRSGTLDSLAAMTADQLRTSWEARRDAATPTFVVVGDAPADTVLPALEAHFGAWAGGAERTAALPAPPAPEAGPRLVMVDAPGSAQSVLQVRLPAPARDADDGVLAGMRLGVTVLGGTFTSRLNRKLREEEGYTYGAWAGFYPQDGFGELIASTQVQREVTAPALRDLLAELRRVQQPAGEGGVVAEELEKARSSRVSDLVGDAGSRDGLADLFTGLVISGRSADAPAAEMAAWRAVDPAGAGAALAGSTLDDATVVVVGDLSEIREGLAAEVPGTWEERDRWGAPLP